MYGQSEQITKTKKIKKIKTPQKKKKDKIRPKKKLKYQNKPNLPFALGMEGAGIISESGKNNSSFNKGDEVIFGVSGQGAIDNSIVLPFLSTS